LKPIIATVTPSLAIIEVRMKTTPPLLESTRLEDIKISKEGISFNMDGQSIWMKQGSDEPCNHALHTLYDLALKHSLKQVKETNQVSWFKKLSDWISRFLKQDDKRPSQELPEKSYGFESKPDTPKERAEQKPIHPVLKVDVDDIQMKAIFSDKEGIHVIWSKTEPGKVPLTEVSTHTLDSEVASTLNACYHHLSRLGYTVVGLDMKPIISAQHSPQQSDDYKKTSTEIIPKKAKVARVVPDNLPEQTIVVRPHSLRQEEPNRLFISPVDNEENILSIPVPENVLHSIRTNIDKSLPEDKRVTFLRCSPYMGTYKIVAVGEGITDKQNAVKWTELSQWNTSKLKAEMKNKLPGPTEQIKRPELQLF
jgi:hypothetical protein